eukprot:m51a1_g3355 hypothetical protein (194) ;mRNA; f:416356-417066
MSAEGFNDEQQKFLLALVRDAARAKFDRKPAPKKDDEARRLGLDQKCGGCFVTYNNHGQLRGCIGCFEPTDPLYKVVESRAQASLVDSRFVYEPITQKEFDDEIDVTISVLTPPVDIKDPLKDVTVGVHGVVVSKGWNRGCYLPQVATEQHWNTKQFVTHCANRKAGIEGDVLSDPEVKWQTFTAVLVREKEH